MNNIQTKLLYAYTSKHLFAIMQDDAHFITQEIEQLLSSLQICRTVTNKPVSTYAWVTT